MANADGSVIIKTDIDDKQAQKELTALEKKIEALQDKLNSKKTARASLFSQANDLGAQLDAAKAKLAQMKSGGEFFTVDAIKQQKDAVAAMEKEWSAVNDKLDKQNASIREGEAELDRMKTKAVDLANQLRNTGKNAGKIQKGLDKASKSMDVFAKRVKLLAKRALVFTFIAQALSKLRDWLSDVVAVNDEARDAIAQLKGALLTLAQPLLQVVIPAFTTLVKVLTAIVSVIAQLVSALFGTTAEDSAKAAKALEDQKNAYKGVGNAAKKAGKQLAAFDEITSISSGSTNSTATSIAPNFSFMDEISPRLEKIAKDIALIGAGFGLWKISENLPGVLGSVGTKLGAILVAISGILLAYDGLNDAWENGVNWENLAEIIAGVAAAAVAIYTAFGKVASGFALAASGITMIVTGFRDIIKNGANLQNTLLTIAGIVATGLGFFFMTGSVIPLVIAGIAAVVTAVLALTGNLEEFCKNLKDNILGGVIQFIKAVFLGDWKMLWDSVKKIFKGAWNGVALILGSAVNLLIDGVNWLIKKINSISISIPDWVPIIGGKTLSPNIKPIGKYNIPLLAQGAVIPPNREFLAVLGDQKHGTNVEAPLETIQQAVAQTFANMSPQLAQAIVSAFIATGMIGNIQAIEDYTRATAAKDFTLGTPNSATGRWVDQSLAAYARVKG